jgi:hypothetical protein
MKNLLLCTLILISMGTPALADHHGAAKADQQMAEQKHIPTGDMLVAHAPMRQARIQELFGTGEMSVSLMKLAHQQMAQAIEKKDHSEVEGALKTFQIAHELHKENMQMMQKMSKHLSEHLNDVKSGTIKLTPLQAAAFEKEVTLFTQQMKAYHADCQENVRPKNQAMRKNALNFLLLDFADAKKAQRADKMVHIAHIMNFLPPFKGE